MIEKKIWENDLTLPILSILRKFGPQTMEGLKKCFGSLVKVGGENLAALVNRNDVKIDQILRNIVSHRDSQSNMIGSGLVDYDNGVLNITEEGENWLLNNAIDSFKDDMK